MGDQFQINQLIMNNPIWYFIKSLFHIHSWKNVTKFTWGSHRGELHMIALSCRECTKCGSQVDINYIINRKD